MRPGGTEQAGPAPGRPGLGARLGLAGRLKPLLDLAADLFLPRRCHLCGAFLDPEAGEEFICPSCRSRLVRPRRPACLVCGRPFASPLGQDRVCESCFAEPPAYTAARYLAEYETPLAEAIRSFKYAGRVELAASLGGLVAGFEPQPPLPARFDLILPVPLHPKRLRRRGFNQAALLARRLARLGEVADGVLVRRRHTDQQTGLSARQRRENVKAAFFLAWPGRVRNKEILIVDDVLTTGATVEECARTLRRAGAGAVYVLTLARVVGF